MPWMYEAVGTPFLPLIEKAESGSDAVERHSWVLIAGLIMALIVTIDHPVGDRFYHLYLMLINSTTNQ